MRTEAEDRGEGSTHIGEPEADWEVEAQGLFGAPCLTVLVGEDAHSTVFKALAMLGLGRDCDIKVPIGTQGRMHSDCLPAVDGPAILCVQAGNLNSGAIDPIAPALDWARARNAWIHVDGALRSVRLRNRAGERCRRAARRDGYGRGLSARVCRAGAVALHSGAIETRQGSRGMGCSALARPQRTCRSDRSHVPACPTVRRRAESPRLRDTERGRSESGSDLFRRRRDDATTTAAMMMAIREDGTCWCSGTRWGDRSVMRISVYSWLTTEEDVDRSLQAMIRCARQVQDRGG